MMTTSVAAKATSGLTKGAEAQRGNLNPLRDLAYAAQSLVVGDLNRFATHTKQAIGKAAYNFFTPENPARSQEVIALHAA